jgi:hypothetical protein
VSVYVVRRYEIPTTFELQVAGPPLQLRMHPALPLTLSVLYPPAWVDDHARAVEPSLLTLVQPEQRQELVPWRQAERGSDSTETAYDDSSWPLV